MNKKLLSLLLALSMCLSLLPTAALARETVCAKLALETGEAVVPDQTEPPSESQGMEEAPIDHTPPEDITASAVASIDTGDDDVPAEVHAAEIGISSAAGLEAMTDGSYKLAKDIDLTGESWSAINFSGTLDGDGYTITLDGKPLFNTLSGKVENLVLDGSVSSTAPLANTFTGSIHNCLIAASASVDSGNASGMVGKMNGGSITNCVAIGELISGSNRFRGVAATTPVNTKMAVANCCWTNGAAESYPNSKTDEKNGCRKITREELASEDFLTSLNENRGDSLTWETNASGIPSPGGKGSAGGVMEADKSELNQKIEVYTPLASDELYTKATRAALADALSAAQSVAGNRDATQNEVDRAIQALDKTEAGLVDILSARVTALDAMNLKEREYSAETWAVYRRALAGARETAGGQDLTLESANAALDELDRAFESLVHSAAADKSGLNAAISATDNKNGLYSAASYDGVQAALSIGRTVRSDAYATQAEVDQATADLLAANEKLELRVFPNLEPTGGKSWTSIRDLEGFLAMEAGGYYRLDTNLDLLVVSTVESGGHETTSKKWEGVPLDAVLDGNGHTVTLHGNEKYKISEDPGANEATIYSNGVFSNIGENGAVFNLGVAGRSFNVNNSPLATNCSGLILNCYSWAGVNAYSGGLVTTLKSGGAIRNSYAASAEGTFTGGLIKTGSANSMIKNSYWLEEMYPNAVSDQTGISVDCMAKSAAELAGVSFRALLNRGLEGVGLEWRQSDRGLPWLGEEQDYVPKEPGRFTLKGLGESTTTVEEKEDLSVSAMEADSTGFVGNLSYSGDGSAAFQVIEGRAVSVTDWGRLAIREAGTAVVGAFDPNERETQNWTYTKELARFTITVTPTMVADARFTIPNAEQCDGTYTVAGRTSMRCLVEVKLEGEDSYRDATTYFDLTGSEQFSIYSIYATPKAPGDGWLNAISKAGIFAERVSLEVRTNSTYVPVEGVTLDLKDSYELHTRQSATTESPGVFSYLGIGSFLPTVSPKNASYSDDWTITSSDDTVVSYGTTMVYNLAPHKAGTATITAEVKDPGNGGGTKTLTGEKTVTLRYKNPIKTFSITSDTLSVKVGEAVDLPIVFTGERDDCAVSETDMIWTFQGEGAVQLLRTPIVVPGNGMAEGDGINSYVANPTWRLTGIKEGTVTVTGMPIDQSSHAAAFSFTVTVAHGDERPQVDYGALIAKGVSGAQKYIANQFENKKYGYGNEWEIFSMSRSGGSIASEQAAAYLDAVEQWLKENMSKADTKPTDLERVALALGAMGEDITDFRGLDVIRAILGSNKIEDGSNESIFALLVLDSRSYGDPAGTGWTRKALIDEIIDRYQTANGSFDLSDKNGAGGVDMTAMALQALAPYLDQNKVAAAVDKALAFLRIKQGLDGGFGNVESTVQVLTALSALKLDPLDEKNGFVQITGDLITNVLSYYDVASGGFSHGGSDEELPQSMSTVQALYGLEAYRRYVNSANRLYDFTDTDPRSALKKQVNTAEKLVQSDYTSESWTAFAKALTDAKTILGDPEAGEQALASAATALADAVAALKIVGGGEPPVDPGKQKIRVTFRLIGCSLSDGSIDFTEVGKNEYLGAEYQTWIKTTSYTLDKGSTVYDLFIQALDDAGLDSVGGDKNYVKTITAPVGYGGYELGEFTNGKRSGWMYTIGGKHPDVGLQARLLQNNDEVIWHYVNDYSYEVEDWGGSHSGEEYPALGDAATWNHWLDAKDVNPPSGSGGASGGGATDDRDSGKQNEVITQVKSEATVDKKTGEAKAVITEKEMTSAISEVKKNHATNIVIEPIVKGDASKVSVELPRESVAAIAKSTKAKLTVKTDIADLSLPNAALAEIGKESGKTVVVSAETVTDKNGKATGQVKVEVKAGDKTLDSVQSGLAVALPVEKPTSGTVLMMITDEGAKIVQKSVVNGKTLAALLDGSATVIVKDNSKSFADVPTDSWAAEAVNFAASHELFQGTEIDLFAPTLTMNRAMLVTVLARLDGQDTTGGETWYEKPIAWAESLGITDGTNPDGSITREQLAVMLHRYLGRPEAKSDDMKGFMDADSVSAWANDAMAWAVNAKIMAGKDSKILDPSGIATRVEVATILQRMVTIMVQ